MKDFSRLTKKELIEELHITKACYKTAHEERMAAFFFLHSLANECYHVAESEIDSLKMKDELKEGLRKMCKTLEKK